MELKMSHFGYHRNFHELFSDFAFIYLFAFIYDYHQPANLQEYH